MVFFSKIKSLFADHNETEPHKLPSASDYVEWLPRYMLSHGETDMEIDSTRPLPGAEEAPCHPTPDAVLNRLKVLSGLHPFRCSEPIDASFSKPLADQQLIFNTRFEDTFHRSTCILHLTLNDKSHSTE